MSAPAALLFDGTDVGLTRSFHLPTRAERRREIARSARMEVFANAAPVVSLLVLFDVTVVFHGLLVARAFAVVFLLLVPGAIVIASCRTRPTDGAVRLALVAAASALYLMLAALAATAVLPRLGVAEPLERRPLVLIVNGTLTLMLLLVARRREPLSALFGTRLPTARQVATVAALAAVPLTAAAGAQAVNHGRGPALAIAALVACGLLVVGLLVAAERVPAWVLCAGLYAVAVAVVYSFSLSGDRLFGWDIQGEFRAFSTTMQANAWHPSVDGDPYRAMLSITALPTVLARLTGVSGVSLFRIVYPLLFALFPVLAFVVAARWLPKVAAFAAAAFVVVQLAFAQQLPAITRQEVALVFFGVLVAVAFDDTLPVRYRRVVVLVAGGSLALTHYSTAYVTSLALLGAWLIGGVLRLARRRVRHRRVLVAWVVLGIMSFTVFWNFGVTHSSGNVLEFAQQAAEKGPEFLPSSHGRSLISRWLSGNAPRRITGAEYARREAYIYEAGAPWLNRYPAAVTSRYPVADAAAPTVAGPLPLVQTVDGTLIVLASQGFVAMTSVGILCFAWQRRREWSSAGELALMGVVLLGFVGAMRVSGVAAEAYNQERAQIHAAAVLSVGLATVAAWFLARWRRLTLVALAGGVTVIFLASSGLAAIAGGGAAPANLVDAGDARERFAVTPAETATAEWLAGNRTPGSLIYTDRYGKLRIWAAATSIADGSLQEVLTPETLDQNAYVFASVSNIVGGRARGAIGPDYAVYAFPRAFLDENKAAIYSTGSTVIYR